MTQKGFTLIEVMMVLVLAVVIYAFLVAIPLRGTSVAERPP